MTEATLHQRLSYAFDRTMSRGTAALIGWLAIASAILVVVFAVLVVLFGVAPEDDSGARPGLVRGVFDSFLHAIDPGTIGNEAIGSSAARWSFLLLMLAVSLGGLFIVSALIGVIATGFEERLSQLRRGRSLVLERDHTLIVGWSASVVTILSELVITSQSERRRRCVVILADRDKVEVEESVRAKIKDLGRLRLVVRTGNPTDLDDLEVVNAREARAIIVLAEDGSDDPDSQVIKTLLALTRDPGRREEAYHIVAVIHDPENLAAARLAGGQETVVIDKRETIARLIVQSARQSGASIVHTELLDFGGDEIYMRYPQELVGRTYGDALFAYEDCAAIGLVQNGFVVLNPPGATPIGAGDHVIAIAEDEHRLAAASPFDGTLHAAHISLPAPQAPRPEHVLVLGWNGRAPAIVNELDGYVVAGSTVTVVADAAEAERELAERCAAVQRVKVRFRRARTDDRRLLASLDVSVYDQVIVLCYSDQLDVQSADARTLVTLLHLRDLAGQVGKHLLIASEMLDDRNRTLAQVTRVDDVIVSDRLISLLVTQISENPLLADVFDELFTAEGSEVYLRPATDYVRAGEQTNFATIVEAARRRSETAIGYRLHAQADDESAAYGVRINPPKSQLVSLSERDRVIVLAVG